MFRHVFPIHIKLNTAIPFVINIRTKAVSLPGDSKTHRTIFERNYRTQNNKNNKSIFFYCGFLHNLRSKPEISIQNYTLAKQVYATANTTFTIYVIFLSLFLTSAVSKQQEHLYTVTHTHTQP